MKRRLRLIPVAATVALVVGCGSSATVTKTVVRPAVSPATGAKSATKLTSSEQAKLNDGIDKFNRDAGGNDAQSAAMDATAEAVSMTGLAAKHLGTQLSTNLAAASDAWTKLSDAILSGDQTAVNSAEQSVGQADGAIGVKQ